MMPQINTDLIKANLSRATPGESLVNDPDTPASYEKAPEFTNVTAASEFIFEKLTEEDNYMKFMEVIIQGTSLMEVAKVLVFSGFNEGRWNPDLMMLLIEPIVYILMALCERADIEFTIDGTLGEEEELDNNNKDYEILKRLQEAQRSNSIPLPAEIEQKIEDMPPPEGLEKELEKIAPEEEIPEEAPLSLLSRG